MIFARRMGTRASLRNVEFMARVRLEVLFVYENELYYMYKTSVAAAGSDFGGGCKIKIERQRYSDDSIL